MNTSHYWFQFGTWGMGIATILLVILTLNLKKSERFHGYLAASITALAFCAYFAMQSGFGAITLGGHTFQLARYADWVFTTPLLLLSLLTIALPAIKNITELRARTVLYASMIGLDVFMIIAGILGELNPVNDKWFWFIVSSIAFVIIPYLLFTKVMKQSNKLADSAKTSLFRSVAGFLTILWVIYPIVWYLSPVGTGAISELATNTAYAILDILAKAVFGLWIVLKLSSRTKSAKEE
jgi:bacteriorhodopsin